MTMEHLRAFSQAMTAFHACATLIPFRYGQCLPSTAAVVAHLDERTQYYIHLLEELDDSSEMGVRLLSPTPRELVASRDAVDPIRSGRDYLEHRRRHYATQDQLGEQHSDLRQQVLETFSGLFLKWEQDREVSNPHGLLSLSFLVHRSEIPNFRQRGIEALADFPAKLLITGPWPPYHFVTESCSESWLQKHLS
jgi:hypothetical protein